MTEEQGASVPDQALVNEAATHLHPSGFDPSRDYRGVCYRPGMPTVADYNEAITDLIAARRQLKSGCLMGCSICGDSGHAPQDGCHHDPLILARKWAAATSVWQCYHCGFVATNDGEAREHFGRNEFDAAACDSDRSGEAVETTGSTEGESAGRQASPQAVEQPVDREGDNG